MKVNACAALALALAVVAPQGLVAQEGEGEDESEPMTDGRDVTLVFGAGGFFEGFDNGMLAEETYVVPEGLVLCLQDIVWYMEGPPGVSGQIGIANTNVDQASTYTMWQRTPTFNSAGQASGMEAFTAGGRVTNEGGINAFATHPVNLTINAVKRPLPPEGTVAPCLALARDLPTEAEADEAAAGRVR